MNLTDLQLELRNLEEHIVGLQNEIEKMKQVVKEDKIDFDKITQLATQYPINNKELAKASEMIQKEYINILSYLLLTSKVNIHNKLLYLTRIAAGCQKQRSAEEIYRSGLKVAISDIETVVEDLKELRQSLIADAMIIANLSQEDNKQILSSIADLASILGCDMEEMRIIAKVVKAIVTNEMEILESITVIDENMWSGKLQHYIPEEWFIVHRINCGRILLEKYPDVGDDDLFVSFLKQSGKLKEKPNIINSCLRSGEMVNKGDIIARYREQIKKDSSANGWNNICIRSQPTEQFEEIERVIKSPCNGIVVSFTELVKGECRQKDGVYMNIYVISYFDQISDFEKWYSENKQ